MAPELALGGLQHWMQSVIVHPGSVKQALRSREAATLLPPGRLETVLRPSATLTAAERIGIYHGMFLLRMAEALEADYLALAHFLGEERWERLVRDYVRDHPSTSYTLNVLGAALAEWIGDQTDLPARGFCQDLARLEWAVTEVFDAEEAERLSTEAIESLPAEAWDEARLVPAATVRLLALRWNVNEWLDSAKDENHAHPKPRRSPGWVVVFRLSYAVYRRALSREAFRLLSDLASGRTVGEAVSAASRRRNAPGAEALSRWFGQWAADGLFTRIERYRPA